MSKAKDIHIETRPLIPRDIIESDLSLQSYLEQNINENRKDEMIRLKLAKARETKREYYLKQKEKKIRIESNTKHKNFGNKKFWKSTTGVPDPGRKNEPNTRRVRSHKFKK
jgi:hypothetical protein